MSLQVPYLLLELAIVLAQQVFLGLQLAVGHPKLFERLDVVLVVEEVHAQLFLLASYHLQ